MPKAPCWRPPSSATDYPYLAADASQMAGLAASGVRVVDQRPAKGAADVWIDFSAPTAAVTDAQAAAAAGAAIVIGTTGVSAADKEKIAAIAKTTPIVLTPNMSMGVNVMLKLVADAARMLGQACHVEIVETHHRAKRDAPSGTALRLGEAVAEATGRDLAQVARYDRHGDIGPRTRRKSGCRPCAAVTCSAITPCSFSARATASKSPTAPPRATPSPVARFALPCGWWANRPDFSTCATCSG